MSNLKPSISILGAAYSPFGNVMSTPSIQGMTYRELAATAILQACDDAGVFPGDVDTLLVSHFTDGYTKNSSHVIAEFVGMQEAAISDIDTACVSPINGVRLAAGLLASGMSRLAAVAAVEVPLSTLRFDAGGNKRNPSDRQETTVRQLRDGLGGPFDQAYFMPIVLGTDSATGPFQGLRYAKRYGVSIARLEDALDAAYINSRRASALNPCAYHQTPLAEEAKLHGYADVRAYLRSDHNPVFDWPYREFARHSPCDGAACVLLCRSQDAKRFASGGRSVRVSGVGAASGGANFGKSALGRPDADRYGETLAIQRAYGMAKLNPSEIEYVGIHDCMLQSHFHVAEKLGYLPPGQGLSMVIDGRTAFDGDRPINTHGGDCAFGNAFDATAMADIVESVRQLRGEAGRTQIAKPPRVAVNHSFGGGSSGGVIVLRKEG